MFASPRTKKRPWPRNETFGASGAFPKAIRLRMIRRLMLLSAAARSLSGASAFGQTPEQPYYNIHEIHFDMWCQEQQLRPPARCDKRLPVDEAAYQAYVDKIQQYEIPYLQD